MARWWLWDEYPFRLVGPLVDLWVGGPNADGRGLDNVNGGYAPLPGLQIVSPTAYFGGVGPLVREDGGWLPKVAGRLAGLQITPGQRTWYGPAPAATNHIRNSSFQSLVHWAIRPGASSLTITHVGGWGQIRGLGADEVDDFWQGTALPTGTRYGLAFLLRRVSTSGTLVVANPYGRSYGEWRINLAALGPGEHLITRRHPAVTVVAEMTRFNGTQAGVHFFSLTGPIDVDLRACTVVDYDDYNWFVPIETLNAHAAIAAEHVILSGLNLMQCTLAIRTDTFVAPKIMNRLWGGSLHLMDGQVISADDVHNIACINGSTMASMVLIGVAPGPHLYWFQRHNATWRQSVDSSPVQSGNLGTTDWSNVNLHLGNTHAGWNSFMQPIRRVMYWPRVLSSHEREAVYNSLIAAEGGS